MNYVTGVHADQVREHLSLLGIDRCPLCSSDSGLDVGEICGMPEIGPAAQVAWSAGTEIGRSNVLAVPATCIRCGYQLLFSLEKLRSTTGWVS